MARLWIRAAALPVGVAGAWLYAPYAASGPVLCLWRRILGVRCPGCGLTRAICRLVRGDPAGAVAANPLVIVVVVGLLAVSVPAWLELVKPVLVKLSSARASSSAPVRSREGHRGTSDPRRHAVPSHRR